MAASAGLSWESWVHFTQRAQRLPAGERSLDCSAFLEATSELEALGKLHDGQKQDHPTGAQFPPQYEAELTQVPSPPARLPARQPASPPAACCHARRPLPCASLMVANAAGFGHLAQLNGTPHSSTLQELLRLIKAAALSVATTNMCLLHPSTLLKLQTGWLHVRVLAPAFCFGSQVQISTPR